MAAIGRTRELDLRILERPPRPADVEVAGVRTACVVGDDVGLVLPRNEFVIGCYVRLFRDWNVIRFPSLPTVERPANENAVARGVVPPIAGGPQFVEGDVAENGMTLLVERNGNVPGDLIVGSFGARRNPPSFAVVMGVRNVGIILIRRDNL